MTLLSPRILVIQECEAAIMRIRAAIRAGTSAGDDVAADFERIQRAALPTLQAYAQWATNWGPEASQEALEAMLDRLFDDVWKLTFPSLETGFGAYLRTMPIQELRRLKRKFVPPGVSLSLIRLDEQIGDGDTTLGDAIPDQRAQAAFDARIAAELWQAAMNELPDDEYRVITWRLADVDNAEIARRLQVSAATATRIYQRAVAHLQQRLNEEP